MILRCDVSFISKSIISARKMKRNVGTHNEALSTVRHLSNSWRPRLFDRIKNYLKCISVRSKSNTYLLFNGSFRNLKSRTQSLALYE